MTNAHSHSWQSIQDTIRSRIEDRTWKPGDLIPAEAELAEEFGCARATVNRALRELASTGVVDRKRKAGTRVTPNRTRKVTGEISIIRIEVENLGAGYRFEIIKKKRCRPPASIRTELALEPGVSALYIQYVHYADNQPYIVEERWINTTTVPEIINMEFDRISANEWLIEHVPFTNGKLMIKAQTVSTDIAQLLSVSRKSSVLLAKRSTWLNGLSVTVARLHYSPDFQVVFDF